VWACRERDQKKKKKLFNNSQSFFKCLLGRRLNVKDKHKKINNVRIVYTIQTRFVAMTTI